MGALGRFGLYDESNIEDHRYFPRLLYHTKIPAFRNARVLPPVTKVKRWPVMVFSHGLGGSRNSYSHIAGSLASHGIVVVAPEHRDGSGPRTYIGGPKGRPVDYRAISHVQSKEVEDARDEQLRIRLWELGLLHEALVKIDNGEGLSNVLSKDHKGDFSIFANSLDVHTPGKISWAGHSFGAATVVQFVKSVFYHASPVPPSDRTLYKPAADSAVVRQITPFSTVNLLDLWTLPLRSATTHWLWTKPFPCYSPDGPGGANLLAVMSEAFFKWRGNLIPVKQAIREDPSREHSSGPKTHSPPYMFYPATSAHLSQSDFGVLFPWLTKKAMKAEEPERTIRLNVRAMLEVLRQNGTEVAPTSATDMEEIPDHHGTKMTLNGHALGNGHAHHVKLEESLYKAQDKKILAADGSIRGWIALNPYNEDRPGEAVNEKTKADADPMDAVLQGEIMGDGSLEGQGRGEGQKM